MRGDMERVVYDHQRTAKERARVGGKAVQVILRKKSESRVLTPWERKSDMEVTSEDIVLKAQKL